MTSEQKIISALRQAADQLGGYAAIHDAAVRRPDVHVALSVQRITARLADIGERTGDPFNHLDRILLAIDQSRRHLLDAPSVGVELAETLASVSSNLAAADDDPRPAVLRAAGGGDMTRVIVRLRSYLNALRSVVSGLASVQALDAFAKRLEQQAGTAARARNPELFAMRDLQIQIKGLRWQMSNQPARAAG